MHLTNLSPLDGRYHQQLAPLRAIFSEYGLIKARTEVEVRWLQCLCQTLPELKNVDSQQLDSLVELTLAQAEEVKALEKTTNHDVKAVEYYLQQRLIELNLSKLIPFLHFGCTSEDINNTAYALMIKQALTTSLFSLLDQVQADLRALSNKYIGVGMLARTHGQPATPTTLGKEFANIAHRLNRQLTQLKDQAIFAKFNGATGSFNAHRVAYPEHNWPSISEKFIESLGLSYTAFSTQIEPHDFIAELMQNIMRINTILIDASRDNWQYISLGYFKLKNIANEVGSSTMPHKINPIDFENAEGNFGLANALAGHLASKLPISRLQRDLSDSTVLRNLGCVFGYSMLAYQSFNKGLSKLEPNLEIIHQDLSQHWEVLAEAIQMVMRRHGIQDAYEQLKAFSRGQALDQQKLTDFIHTLTLPDPIKTELLSLSPATYLGYSVELTQQLNDHV